MLFLLASIFGRGGNDADDDSRYGKLIADNLKFIEERCYKAYGMASSRYAADNISGANRADALLVEVLDHLKADGYRVLKSYKGRSSIKRYLEVVISNKVVDLYRHREGRSRAAEEARKMGDTGTRLYELVFEGGMPVHEAHELLVAETGYDGDIDALEDMADRISAKRRHSHKEVSLGGAASGDSSGHPRLKVTKDDSGEITVPDERSSPERILSDGRKEASMAGVLKEIAGMLSPEERLMVMMRFNGGMKIKEIAAALSISEKNAYRRFDAMLSRCRKMLTQKGVELEDLL